MSRLRARAAALRRRRPRLILDVGPRLGDFGQTTVGFETSLRKEEVAREHVLGRQPGQALPFLDVGARDGELKYLLGISENLKFDDALYARNKATFDSIYDYHGLDLSGPEAANVISGDVCDEGLLQNHPEWAGHFSVIYSNNVFEHLRKPWVAARNLIAMLAPGGICITITCFALRYHESPDDYFRFTHTGLDSLFEDAGGVRVLVSGYDLCGRRNDWQGLGESNDIVPTDRFGAWRENWFVMNIVEREA